MNETPTPNDSSKSLRLAIVVAVSLGLIVAAFGAVALFGERVTHVHSQCAEKLEPSACEACCSEMAYGHSAIELRDGVSRCTCSQ